MIDAGFGRARPSVLSLLILFASSNACGLGGGGDGGLVPFLLGLAPPSKPVTAAADTASGAASSASTRTQPAPPPSRIAPKQSAPSAPEQKQTSKPASELGRDLANEPSVDEKLRALKRLHDRHLLSDAEYESRRARILGSN